MGNDAIRFSARFGGVSYPVSVPVQAVLAIYARETGQGMALPDDVHAAGDDSDLDSDVGNAEDSVTTTLSAVPSDPVADGDDDGPPSPTPTPRRGGHLRIVK
jgi:stringent starvation protein B